MQGGTQIVPTFFRINSEQPRPLGQNNAKIDQQRPTTDSHDDPYSPENLASTVKRLHEEAEMQRKHDELAECVQLTADLVDVFGRKIILPRLRKCYSGPLVFSDWHHDLRHYITLSYVSHLPQYQKTTIFGLMIQMDKIVEYHGISKDQWADLVYLNVTTNPHEYIPINNEQLNHIHELAKNSALNRKLKDAVHALLAALKQKRSTPSRVYKRRS